MTTPQEAMRQEFEASARSEGMPLVSMWISVGGNKQVTSDVQTHDNSYADVSRGLAIIRGEIERVFVEQKSCPHYPANSEQAKRPIVRSPAALRAQPEAVQDEWLEKAMELADEYARLEAVAEGEGFPNGADVTNAEREAQDARDQLEEHLSARLLPPKGWQMVRAALAELVAFYDEAQALIADGERLETSAPSEAQLDAFDARMSAQQEKSRAAWAAARTALAAAPSKE